MKLNIECIRDILFYLENHLILNDELEFCFLDVYEISEALCQYSKEDIAYTILLLDEAGFIDATADYAGDCINNLDVSRMTYEGHQFLETIRPIPVWKQVLSVSGKVGCKSLDYIASIASGILSKTLSEILNQNLLAP